MEVNRPKRECIKQTVQQKSKDQTSDKPNSSKEHNVPSFNTTALTNTTNPIAHFRDFHWDVVFVEGIVFVESVVFWGLLDCCQCLFGLLGLFGL